VLPRWSVPQPTFNAPIHSALFESGPTANGEDGMKLCWGLTMQIYYAPPFHPLPPHVVCPACGDRMRLLMIAPLNFERGADEMTFRCDECEIEC
jgi:hypothetical protein